MKHFFTKMGGHKKFLTFSKISSGPLPGINNDWSLRNSFFKISPDLEVSTRESREDSDLCEKCFN